MENLAYHCCQAIVIIRWTIEYTVPVCSRLYFVVFHNDIDMVIDVSCSAVQVADRIANVLSRYELIGVQDRCRRQVVNDPVVVVLRFDGFFEIIHVLRFQINLTKNLAGNFAPHVQLM